MDFSKIREAADRDRAAVTKFLQDIMRIKSLSGGEKQVVERIAAEMRATGFDEVRIDGLGNVIGRIGSGPRSIAMDAHIDTVDVGNPDNWEIDPFSARREGRRRLRPRRLRHEGRHGEPRLRRPSIVRDLGAREGPDHLCHRNRHGGGLRRPLLAVYPAREGDRSAPECVVIAEPTNLNIYRGHRGRMEMEVAVPGSRAHGSAPERGVNAVYKMAPIMLEIEQLNGRLRHDDFLGKGTVTIAEVRSTSPSLCAVADSCTIHLDRRLTAGETIETAVAEIEALPAVKAANGRVRVLDYAAPAYTGLVYPTKKYYPTWVLAEDHPALKAAVSAYEKVFGGETQGGQVDLLHQRYRHHGHVRHPQLRPRARQ